MCDDLYDSMKEYYDSVKKYKNFNEEFYCFGEDKGITPIPYSTARRRKVVVAERAGVKENRLHDFRHSCASLLINSGANIRGVSKYLGHSDINETLNTYSHMFPNNLTNAKSAIDSLNKSLIN